jgi:hypothetical protein
MGVALREVLVHALRARSDVAASHICGRNVMSRRYGTASAGSLRCPGKRRIPANSGAARSRFEESAALNTALMSGVRSVLCTVVGSGCTSHP